MRMISGNGEFERLKESLIFSGPALKLHVVLFITSERRLAMKWHLMRMCTS